MLSTVETTPSTYFPSVMYSITANAIRGSARTTYAGTAGRERHIGRGRHKLNNVSRFERTQADNASVIAGRCGARLQAIILCRSACAGKRKRTCELPLVCPPNDMALRPAAPACHIPKKGDLVPADGRDSRAASLASHMRCQGVWAGKRRAHTEARDPLWSTAGGTTRTTCHRSTTPRSGKP